MELKVSKEITWQNQRSVTNKYASWALFLKLQEAGINFENFEFIIQKLNPLVVVNFRFISSFLHAYCEPWIHTQGSYKISSTSFSLNLTLMSWKQFYSFKDFQSDQIQRSSRKIFTTHYACRNAYLNLTPGKTNGFIFQIINSLIEFWGVRLTCLNCNVFKFTLYVPVKLNFASKIY